MIVVGHKSPEFAGVVRSLRKGQTVVDLARLAGPIATDATYEGICW